MTRKHRCSVRFLMILAGSMIAVFGLKSEEGASTGSNLGSVQKDGPPLRLAVAGLVHGHVQGFLNKLAARKDIVLVGIAEPDALLAEKYSGLTGIGPARVFKNLGELLDSSRPQAVAAFTSTLGHLEVVRACAARGIPVMMEKPLAVSLEQGREMARLVNAAGIPLVVNYETTWYPSNQLAYSTAVVNKGLGEIRKIVVHDGHSGPKEIGCPEEFLRWLTDPVENGAGALFDFGCYGANLATWLMGNRRPLTVTAITQQIKPTLYPKVDDEATLILTYEKAQVIIQASWNWPYDRKDMEIYGTSGYLLAIDRQQVRLRVGKQTEKVLKAEPLSPPMDEALNYLAAVARGRIRSSSLSSLENNLMVTEILDAARRSAQGGTTVQLPDR